MAYDYDGARLEFPHDAASHPLQHFCDGLLLTIHNG